MIVNVEQNSQKVMHKTDFNYIHIQYYSYSAPNML